MAAMQNVPQQPEHCNFIPITPQGGVVTVYGYGITVHVDRGHLSIQDGIGGNRREARFPRVGHGLRRLIIIGSDGLVSLAALRWLADQDAAFVMLDRQGSVLATTGPVQSSDARLRRAQALAHHSGAALQISRELIGQKLERQGKLAREQLNDLQAAEAISRAREAIPSAQTIKAIRVLESRGAYAYWGAWNELPINFPKSDLRRVPDHWRTFRNRISPLTGSPRLAANPVNAMLNYLYALLESEARLAVAALGLDPCLGVMHMDTPARDSLACDVMEPVRPIVDAYLLNWVRRETLRREWFFEQRDGSCRLMGPFAVQLGKTSPTWANAVAPFAEFVSRTLWSTARKSTRQHRPATRLTQLNRRESRAILADMPVVSPPKPESFCRDCGAAIGQGGVRCAGCSGARNTALLVKSAAQGRVAGQSDRAQKRRAETQSKHATARYAWRDSMNPTWLNREFYVREIQPRLSEITLSVLASTLSISIPYSIDIRKGRRTPHPRHWQTLANLVGVTEA